MAEKQGDIKFRAQLRPRLRPVLRARLRARLRIRPDLRREIQVGRPAGAQAISRRVVGAQLKCLKPDTAFIQVDHQTGGFQRCPLVFQQPGGQVLAKTRRRQAGQDLRGLQGQRLAGAPKQSSTPALLREGSGPVEVQAFRPVRPANRPAGKRQRRRQLVGGELIGEPPIGAGLAAPATLAVEAQGKLSARGGGKRQADGRQHFGNLRLKGGQRLEIQRAVTA